MIPLGERSNDHARVRIAVPTALPLRMRSAVREVVDLHTEPDHRRQGHAKALMQRICIDADLTDTWLLVHVDPRDGVPIVALGDFYAALGFAPIQASPLLMTRPPAKAALNVH